MQVGQRLLAFADRQAHSWHSPSCAAVLLAITEDAPMTGWRELLRSS